MKCAAKMIGLVLSWASLIISCAPPTGQDATGASGRQGLFSPIGEWELDSVVGASRPWGTDVVIITSNNEFWRFAQGKDRYLVDSCLVVKDSCVLVGQEVRYQLQVIDSTSISVASNGDTLIYRNLDRLWKSDFAKSLTELRAGDALYRRVTGWWKLRQASWRPIKLVNYPDPVNDFTLHLGRDGLAHFYVENDPDSVIEYSWEPADSALGLGRGCIVGARAPIFEIEENRMVMSMDARLWDTLYFERCEPLVEMK